MDPPPLIQRALLRLLLEVGVSHNLHRPRPGVGGAAAEEVEPSPPRGSDLLRLLLRLPVPHVSRLLPPGARLIGAATPLTTTASASTVPSLADFVVVLAAHRLRRQPPPRAGIDDDRPMEILEAMESALLRVIYHIAVDEQPVRAASDVPSARTAITRSLFNRIVYLELRRVRRMPPPRAALDSDSHPLVTTPATGNRTTTLTTLLPRLLTRVPLFIRHFTRPSAEAHVDATTAVMGLPLRRPSHSLFRLLVIRALHRARQQLQAARYSSPRQPILAFLSSLWRARQVVTALFQSPGGGGAVGAVLGFLILTNTRTTRRLMALSHALFPRGQMSRLQVIAIGWSVFHMSMLLGFFSSPRTQGGLVGRSGLQGDDAIDEFPVGNADGMNFVLAVDEPRRPSVLPLLAFLLFKRRAQQMYYAQSNAFPNQYVNVADSNKSSEELPYLLPLVPNRQELPYLMGGSSEELLVAEGDTTDGVCDNGSTQTKERIVVSSFEEACQVINKWREGDKPKPEPDVEIALGTPASTVKKISLEFAKCGVGCLLNGEAITPLSQKNHN